MKLLSRILIIYSFLFSLFILFSGVVGSGKTNSLIWALLFLPIIVYTLSELIGIVRKKDKKRDEVVITPTKIAVVTIPFILLTVFAVFNISKEKEVPENPVSQWETADSESKGLVFPKKQVEKKQYIKVEYVEGESVNIRQEPTTASEIIGKAQHGETYELVATESGWVQILLEGETQGYISDKYATISAENPSQE